MIFGAVHWADRSRYFVQTNNPTEEELRKLGFKAWLQSCGSSAGAMGAAVVGYDISIRCPGGYVLPADEALTDFFNDPGNYPKFRLAAPKIDPAAEPGNRHAAYYPIAAREVLGVTAAHWWGVTPGRIVEHLRRRRAVQACIDPPGHYIIVVAYDPATEELIYNDPWPTRKPQWHGDGFNQRFTALEVEAIVSEGVIWLPPGDAGEEINGTSG
jgi:hypothetical protein